MGGIVVGHGLHTFGLTVGEIFTHSTVGVDVHQAGDHVIALSVKVGLAFQLTDSGDGLFKFDIGVLEGLADENLAIFNTHWNLAS